MANYPRMKDYVVCAVEGCKSLISDGHSIYCKQHQVEVFKRRHCESSYTPATKKNYTPVSYGDIKSRWLSDTNKARESQKEKRASNRELRAAKKEQDRLERLARKIARHERSMQHNQAYQHEYYLSVTKPKRIARRTPHPPAATVYIPTPDGQQPSHEAQRIPKRRR